MTKLLGFKNDRYRRNRGGYSRWLLLTCANCKTLITFYQKDGPGILKRLYLDRMQNRPPASTKNLVCTKCRTVLGIRTTYKKESRPAFGLLVGAVEKQLVKADKIASTI